VRSCDGGRKVRADFVCDASRFLTSLIVTSKRTAACSGQLNAMATVLFGKLTLEHPGRCPPLLRCRRDDRRFHLGLKASRARASRSSSAGSFLRARLNVSSEIPAKAHDVRIDMLTSQMLAKSFASISAVKTVGAPGRFCFARVRARWVPAESAACGGLSPGN